MIPIDKALLATTAAAVFAGIETQRAVLAILRFIVVPVVLRSADAVENPLPLAEPGLLYHRPWR
jgi:hypothetical protein